MSTGTRGRPVRVLLVEDNPMDIRLIQETLRVGRVRKSVDVVRDGEEAMAFLDRQGRHRDAKRPNIILLDLNLPKRGGREVLMALKSHSDLKRIPVVVLTTSRAEEDILEAYNLHANSYVVKPTDLDEFAAVVKAVEAFWLEVAALPPEP